MDPVGPWTAAYAASYNRLTGAGGFQPTAASGGDFSHNSAPNPSTTSQLLLQAAHATSTLAGLSPAAPSPAFNPGGFLSPPPVGYDAVFSPFLHHANQKAHYTQALNVAQHRQAIASSKQSTIESDALRENYNSVHHQALAPNPAFFDQASSAVQPTPIAWSHQNNAQLPSPFGVLPHESVVGNGPGGPNFNAAHFAAAHTLNHINSQLVAAGYSDPTKRLTSRPVQSPPSKNPLPLNVTSSSSYFQQSPSSYSRSEIPPSQFPLSKAQADTAKSYDTSSNKVYLNSSISGSAQQPQTHVTSASSTNSSEKDYNLSLPQVGSTSAVFSSRVQDKQSSRGSARFQSPTTKNTVNNTILQSKLQSNPDRRDSSHEPSQSSPISYAMMDSAQHRSTAAAKISSSSRTTASNVQQSQLQQQLLAHQKSGSYRGFPSSSGSTPESEYSQGSGNRNSIDGGYSSGSSVGQNGAECNTLQRSPINHSQPSPLGQVTSPAAYPIYHSPMTSMSSPSPVQQHSDQIGSYKQNPSPKVAPPSPLDASVPRPSSVGQAGYSSVITRNDQNYPNERSLEFSQKACWEGTEHQQLRSHNAKYPVYSAGDLQNTNNVPIQQQRAILGLTERQQAYFDSTPNQHNLVSDRGDPMIIVKNLQTLQQQCQAPPNPIPVVDVKPIVENSKSPVKNSSSPAKRKKSVECKVETNPTVPEYVHRVPPPAHLNTNQPQQNGGFSEFDRWNVPQTHKMLSGAPVTFGNQNPLHPSENIVNPAVVSNPHQPSTSHHSTYYQSFHHSSASQINEGEHKNSTTSSSSINNDSTPVETPKIEDIPVAKVIVPNVEEELGFLVETPKVNSKLVDSKNCKLKVTESKPIIPFSNPNSGFMASYIKFLQGEKESSPPPVKRKLTKPTYIAPLKTEVTVKKEIKSSKSTPHDEPPDFEDDPRYFPLPKDSSNRKLDPSSDSDMTDYDALIPQTTYRPEANNNTNVKSGQQKSNTNRANTKINTSRNNNSRRTRSSRKRTRDSSGEEEVEDELPKRNSVKRKAKEKISSLEEKDDMLSGMSDWDPAWSPEEDSDEDFGLRRSSRGKRKPAPKSKRQRKISSRFLESSDEENNVTKTPVDKNETESSLCEICQSVCDEPKDSVGCYTCKKIFHISCCSLSTAQRIKKLGSKRRFWKCDDCKPQNTSENKKPTKKTKPRRRKLNGDGAPEPDFEDSLGTEEYFPFKSGEFIVVKTDLKEDFPAIWRVDGKTLLQKYEPFDQNGEKLYRNISTYSGWTTQNRNIYQRIPVQFIVQSRIETIVKFLRSEMVDPAQEQAFLEQSLNETSTYQDNFEVYIQTLISQALDSNFLAEIFAEKDEYFLQNVEVIDNLTEERRLRLVAALDWPLDSSIQRSVTTWPCYNVLADLKASQVKLCDACFRSRVHARIILYGQPYNNTTLDGMTPDSKVINQKDFMICLDCIKWVQLYNKLVHQKYIMYIECAKQVAEKKSTDPNKDTTVVLNELLADEDWLTKLFLQVRVTWADVEKAEREKNRRLGIKVLPGGDKISPGQKAGDKSKELKSCIKIVDLDTKKEFQKEIKIEVEDEGTSPQEQSTEDEIKEIIDPTQPPQELSTEGEIKEIIAPTQPPQELSTEDEIKEIIDPTQPPQELSTEDEIIKIVDPTQPLQELSAEDEIIKIVDPTQPPQELSAEDEIIKIVDPTQPPQELSAEDEIIKIVDPTQPPQELSAEDEIIKIVDPTQPPQELSAEEKIIKIVDPTQPPQELSAEDEFKEIIDPTQPLGEGLVESSETYKEDKIQDRGDTEIEPGGEIKEQCGNRSDNVEDDRQKIPKES